MRVKQEICAGRPKLKACLTPGGEQFYHSTKHLITAWAIESERQLGGEQTVFDANIVATSLKFAGQVTLMGSELGQCSCQVDCPAFGVHFALAGKTGRWPC